MFYSKSMVLFQMVCLVLSLDSTEKIFLLQIMKNSEFEIRIFKKEMNMGKIKSLVKIVCLDTCKSIQPKIFRCDQNLQLWEILTLVATQFYRKTFFLLNAKALWKFLLNAKNSISVFPWIFPRYEEFWWYRWCIWGCF